MIVQKEFLNKLKDFGLNTYESKLWTALLSRGVSTAGELSDIANVPRSRSYDVLESLEKKGFIIMKLGKPIKYIAVPPEEVLDRIKKRLKQDSEKQIYLLNELKESEVLGELNLLHSQGIELVDPSELSGSLKGRNNLYSHLDSMIKKAEKSIVIVTTTRGLLRKQDTFKNSLSKAKKKGVKVKILAPITKECKDAVKNLKPYAEIKNIKDLNARFTLVDSNELLFMLLNDSEVHPTYDTGIWINSGFFVSAMENMFNSIWKLSKSAELK
ncbi:MAG: helix-turn-helix domain-containing protein [Nanoarchaeota archaeon]|nr:helix-turn-helix domain-containing protein [Nanoarchaeota archaeon]